MKPYYGNRTCPSGMHSATTKILGSAIIGRMNRVLLDADTMVRMSLVQAAQD